MTAKRMFLFRLGTVLTLLLIAVVMFIVGRGHTVYFDNKTFEYEGNTYSSLYKVVINDGGNEVAQLMKRERGMATWIGQDLRMSLEATREKDGETISYPLELKLPYRMDGIVVNLPAMLAGLPVNVYMSEFVPQTPETAAGEELIITDEFVVPEL